MSDLKILNVISGLYKIKFSVKILLFFNECSVKWFMIIFCPSVYIVYLNKLIKMRFIFTVKETVKTAF